MENNNYGYQAFKEELIKEGISETRIFELYEALDKLHSALSKCDKENLSILSDKGLKSLLRLFIEVNPGLNVLSFKLLA